MKTIKHGKEYWKLHVNGQIERPGIYGPSNSWKVVGAVRLNSLGHVIEEANLDDILSGKIKEWQHKNGKQKWFIIDFDHGTKRQWTIEHCIF